MRLLVSRFESISDSLVRRWVVLGQPHPFGHGADVTSPADGNRIRAISSATGLLERIDRCVEVRGTERVRRFAMELIRPSFRTPGIGPWRSRFETQRVGASAGSVSWEVDSELEEALGHVGMPFKVRCDIPRLESEFDE